MKMPKITYQKGSKGQEVRRLQKALGVKPDGVFGKRTGEAVKLYQFDNQLSTDGIVGPLTLASLGLEHSHGIDVSRWNGNIRWGNIDLDNCQYAWVKCSQGVDWYDKKREHNFQGARSMNIPVGGYHFPSPHIGNSQDPKKEVQQFLRALGTIQSGDMLPVLDLEAGVKGDPEHNRQWALEFLKEFEAETGIRCAVYTARWYVGSYLKGKIGDLKNYPLWVADYTNSRTEPDSLCGWDEWSIWQWTGSGYVAGLDETGIRRVDRNIIPGGKAGFDKLRVK